MNNRNQKRLRAHVLSEALKLLEKGWTKETGARDYFDYAVDYQDPTACKFCALGSIAHVIQTDYTANQHLFQECCQDLLVELFGLRFSIDYNKNAIAEFNDQQENSKPVLDLFAKTIERLKKGG